MLANTLLRVQSDLVIPLFDTFDRADSTDLGLTSTGDRAWQELIGDWDISSNRLRAVSGTDPVAVVDANTPDVDITLDVSSTGRDAIIFRASDADNWWRLSNYYSSSSSTTNIYTYTRYCYNLAAECEGVWPTTMTTSNCGSCPTCNVCYQSNLGCNQTDTVCDTSTSTSTTRRVYLHRMVAGTLEYITYWNAFTTSKLRVVANGDQLSFYSGSGTTFEGTRTETFNQNATQHGVGRSQIGNSGTAIDNFNLLPIEA